MAQLILVTSRCWMQNCKLHQRRWNGSKESRDRNCHGISTGSLSLAMCGLSSVFLCEHQKATQWVGHVWAEQLQQNRWPTRFGSEHRKPVPSNEGKQGEPSSSVMSISTIFLLAIHTLWKKNHGTSTRRLTGFIYEVSKTGYIFSLQVFRNISLPLKHARLPFLAVLECLSELIKPFNSQRYFTCNFSLQNPYTIPLTGNENTQIYQVEVVTLI